MGSNGNSRSTLFWTVVGGIIVAIIGAVGAYYSGGASKEREISATQTAESRLLPPTSQVVSAPHPTSMPTMIEATRIVTLEVTRLVEVTRIVQVPATVESTPNLTPIPDPNTSSPNPLLTPTTQNVNLVQTLGAITYRLDQITFEGGDMIFWIMAFNERDDNIVQICDHACELTDDQGNEHSAFEIIFNNKVSSSNIITIKGGVDIRVGIHFKEMARVKSIQRFDITLSQVGSSVPNTGLLQGRLKFMLKGVQIPFKASSN